MFKGVKTVKKLIEAFYEFRGQLDFKIVYRWDIGRRSGFDSTLQYHIGNTRFLQWGMEAIYANL